MTISLVNGFLLLMALFVALLALAGLVTLSRRIDRMERRRVYETECLVKSLQALEQQNLMLGDKVGHVFNAGQRLASELDRAARQVSEEGGALPSPPPGRILH